MRIDKETQVCVSFGTRPSNFGCTVHNAGFQALGLNFIYKAFRVDDIGSALQAVRVLGIRGCGISMPFKEAAMRFVDALDPVAAAIGAVNTVVNDGGRLTGYNTDCNGARRALERIPGIATRAVVLLGAGGGARAISYGLAQLGVMDVTVVNRTEERARRLAESRGFRWEPWEKRSDMRGDVLINATSLGMAPNADDMPVPEDTVERFFAVADVVVSPMESPLVRAAQRAGKLVVPGYRMSLFQAAEQFSLYTGQDAPLEVMERSLLSLL